MLILPFLMVVNFNEQNQDFRWQIASLLLLYVEKNVHCGLGTDVRFPWVFCHCRFCQEHRRFNQSSKLSKCWNGENYQIQPCAIENWSFIEVVSTNLYLIGMNARIVFFLCRKQSRSTRFGTLEEADCPSDRHPDSSAGRYSRLAHLTPLIPAPGSPLSVAHGPRPEASHHSPPAPHGDNWHLCMRHIDSTFILP